MKTIEFCTNDEWYKVFGPFDSVGLEDDVDDAVTEYIDTACAALRDDPRAEQLDVMRANGQRITCHGWNGAQFDFSAGGFGTFETLTADEQAALLAADEAGTAAFDKCIAKDCGEVDR